MQLSPEQVEAVWSLFLQVDWDKQHPDWVYAVEKFREDSGISSLRLNYLKRQEEMNRSEGLIRISNERQRQIDEKGFSPEHDDDHTEGELADAAICYAMHDGNLNHRDLPFGWPRGWDNDFGCHWKPEDRVTNLTKAGALIAAEIDRLLRAYPSVG
jgi:hypothetical protein